MKRVLFLFSLLLMMHVPTSAQVNFKLPLHIKLAFIGGDTLDGIVKIKKKGGSYKEVKFNGVDRSLDLDMNSYYLIECSKKGFVTKVVYIDTRIPKGRDQEAFAKVTMTIELHKEENNVKVDTSKPVGGFKYIDAVGDFDTMKN